MAEERSISMSSVKINELKPALDYVCSQKHGSLEELRKNLTQQRIDLLAAAGFIAYGATFSHSTWKVTETAISTKDNLNFNRKLSFLEKVQDLICRYILHV
ncbi:MAG: hypothetical protein J6S11_02215 [Bacteroidaceae bacterium]|nr:hypothetical protein [Bacteroidaceae bacterium]